MDASHPRKAMRPDSQERTLRVQRDGLAADLVELLLADDLPGDLHCWGEDAALLGVGHHAGDYPGWWPSAACSVQLLIFASKHRPLIELTHCLAVCLCQAHSSAARTCMAGLVELCKCCMDAQLQCTSSVQ